MTPKFPIRVVDGVSSMDLALITVPVGAIGPNGELDLTGLTGSLPFSTVTGTSQQAAVNSGYIANNVALVTITLPDTAPVGSIVAVQGFGAGGWRIAQNASEDIKISAGGVDGVNETTEGTGGSISSIDQYDAVELVCLVANTTWGIKTFRGAGLSVV
jgi:hypothetical protein